jgi:hypothetical protein
MSCSICLDDFNKSTRTPIHCSYCNDSFCRKCTQTYLLEQTAAEPGCPGCNTAWNREFLNANLTATFRTKAFKEHREKVLYDSERVRLPDTQDDAARFKEAQEILEPLLAERKRLREAIASLPEVSAYYAAKQRRDVAYREYARLAHKDKLTNVVTYALQEANIARDEAAYAKRKAVHKLVRQLSEITQTMTRPEQIVRAWGREPRRRGEGPEVPKERRAFILRCAHPGCEGFVSTAYVCGLCKKHTCKDCREPKHDDMHVCNPETVKTIEAIAKDSRACPQCGVHISRIHGCDMMFCTMCHTAFCWRTGKVETTHIHNPHYFEWMRAQGRDPTREFNVAGYAVDACGGTDAIYNTLVRYIRNPHHRSPEVTAAAEALTDYMGRINRHYQLQHLQRQADDYNNDEWRRQLRVKRLVNVITDEAWKTELQKHEKAHHKFRSFHQLMAMYTGAAMDILHSIRTHSILQVYEQLVELLKFVEKEDEAICKTYGCVSYSWAIWIKDGREKPELCRTRLQRHLDRLRTAPADALVLPPIPE